MRVIILLAALAASLAAQDSSILRNPNYWRSCTATVTTNCNPRTDASGNLAIAATFLNGVISPAALAGDQNDYAPANCSTATSVRIDGGAADRNITGLVCGAAEGRIVHIVNIGATNKLTLVSESVASTAANRFSLAEDLDLDPNAAASLRYDATSSRWRVFGGGGGGGAVAALYTTQSAATNTNIGATTMYANPAATHLYRFDWFVELTQIGADCTGNTTVTINAVYQTPGEGAGAAVSLGVLPLATGGNGTVGRIAWGSDLILAKASTNVQYSTTAYTAGAGCTTNPTYQVSPSLVQIW